MKYKFTFLFDPSSFDFSNLARFESFEMFATEKLTGNRKTPEKIKILLDYFYRKRYPESEMSEVEAIQVSFYLP